MLAVAKVNAENRNAVIGVAAKAFAVNKIAVEGGNEQIDFVPKSGMIAPDDYLVIITEGLAPAVNLDSLAVAATLQVGDKAAISASGAVTAAGVDVDQIEIGKVAGLVDEVGGTVALFVDID